MENELEYLFHVHKTVPLWRLVISKSKGFPAETTAEEWRFTRARTAEDTNVEVREMIDADGYSLFKVGGTFADVERDRRAGSLSDCERWHSLGESNPSFQVENLAS